jgi:cysteine desulfurase
MVYVNRPGDGRQVELSRMSTECPIYLDYQASTPMDPRVQAVVAEAMRAEFGNPSSESHVFGWRAHALVETSRGAVGAAIGALPDEVIFTSGATEADNLGVLGAAIAAPPGRRRILVSAIEHKAVLEAAEATRERGFTVEIVRVTPFGVVDLDDLRARLGPDVAVVSVMAVNNEIGTVQPIEQVAELAGAAGAFVHTDATQAPAAMHVDVLAWKVDAASFSSHKVYGPKGVGALYLAASAPWRPRALMHGGGQERGLRPGTLPGPLCAGFGVAMTLCAEGEELDRIAQLRDAFAARLRALWPTLEVTCEATARHPGNLHVRFPGREATELLARLQPIVCAATGSACTSGIIGPSHVLIALGQDVRAAEEGIRFSLGRFTTEVEVERAAIVIRAALDVGVVDDAACGSRSASAFG